MGQKYGGGGRGAVPLWEQGAGSPSNIMWPGPRTTSLPSGILIHLAVACLATTDMAPKIGGFAFLGDGRLGPHLT